MPNFDLRWVWVILLVLFAVAYIWRDVSGVGNPDWMKCKESLATQMFTGSCTLRDSYQNSAN